MIPIIYVAITIEKLGYLNQMYYGKDMAVISTVVIISNPLAPIATIAS
jgi:hypothetical protein